MQRYTPALALVGSLAVILAFILSPLSLVYSPSVVMMSGVVLVIVFGVGLLALGRFWRYE